MARGDPLFAKLEASFFDERPDFMELPEGARFLYLWLWAQAVSQRREFLVRPSIARLSTLSNLHARWMLTYLSTLSSIGLVSLSDRFIQVIGVAKKHNKISFKATPNGEQTGNKRGLIELNVIELNGTKPNMPTPKPGAPKPERMSDPRIKVFIDHYFQEYQKAFGKKYLVQGAKDAQAVKRALGTLDLDDLKNLLPEFFADPLAWMGQNPNYGIAIFISQINRYGNGNPNISPQTRERLAGLVRWYQKGEKQNGQD